MKIACMQPYFVPYIGYWQLINAVDRFVILDDVQYITRGWINRNKICVNDKDQWITIPLKDASKNKLINEIQICPTEQWIPKLQRTILYNFRKSPNFEEGYKLFNKILSCKINDLTSFLVRSIKLISEYLDINTKFFLASELLPKQKLKAQERIISLCKDLDGCHYYNLSGGVGLYNERDFKVNDLKLFFIKTKSENSFLNSILECLMIYSKDEIKNEIKNFSQI